MGLIWTALDGGFYWDDVAPARTGSYGWVKSGKQSLQAGSGGGAHPRAGPAGHLPVPSAFLFLNVLLVGADVAWVVTSRSSPH